MSGVLLTLICVALFASAYVLYGRSLCRRFGIRPEQSTPAHTLRDGIDYVPAKREVLLGHHFASIAGAGPIVGPVLGVLFGWLPALLWIVLGGIFIGAVHDFSALVASVRHQGRSIGEVIEQHVGRRGKILFLAFSWSTLVLVVAVFAKIVAKTFEANPGVASSSILFIPLAVAFGWFNCRTRLPLAATTAVGVLLLFAAIPAGGLLPIQAEESSWVVVLFAYCGVASVLPVWILLQPRDYLNSFLLYALLGGGLVGLFFYRPTLHFPAFTAFRTELGPLFPILFVTVACGAISGFHSLVSSGTTAKQLDRETDATFVGFGAMLIESLLAVVALVAAAHFMADQYQELKLAGGPIHIFSQGVGSFIATLGIPAKSARSFAALAVSAFALTTLDTATRLARFAFQELFATSRPSKLRSALTNRFAATLLTLAVCIVLMYSGGTERVWPLFGSANQLLAALALLAVSVWLARKAQSNFFVKYPMLFMYAVSLSALAIQAWQNFRASRFLLSGLACLLLLLALFLAGEARRTLRAGLKRKEPLNPLPDAEALVSGPETHPASSPHLS